jgi:hypothetical protein
VQRVYENVLRFTKKDWIVNGVGLVEKWQQHHGSKR